MASWPLHFSRAKFRWSDPGLFTSEAVEAASLVQKHQRSKKQPFLFYYATDQWNGLTRIVTPVANGVVSENGIKSKVNRLAVQEIFVPEADRVGRTRQKNSWLHTSCLFHSITLESHCPKEVALLIALGLTPYLVPAGQKELIRPWTPCLTVRNPPKTRLEASGAVS